jgi:dihydroneopterin aldolase/2-amino-4-hydroxy-6-hydroxymethyldihydropteridine diphosphokinase/dihydropteroate synthase
MAPVWYGIVPLCFWSYLIIYVIQVQTNLHPITLLSVLKVIEEAVGRVPSVRNGPRAIDLDILFYESYVVDTRPEGGRENIDDLEGQLIIPHPRMAEREFVLRPLNE